MRLLYLLVSTISVATFVYATCSSLGLDATDTAGNFTFAAYNAAAGTTTPLTLTIALTVPHTSYHILTTAPGPSSGWLDFTMSNGIISAIPPNNYLAPALSIGNLAPTGTQYPLPAGPWPVFANTYASPSQLFCSVPNPAGGNPVLALYEHTDLFSLCTSYISQTLPVVTTLLYNASTTAVGSGYDTYKGATCKPVIVLLVPS